jgi:hypothetical protein
MMPGVYLWSFVVWAAGLVLIRTVFSKIGAGLKLPCPIGVGPGFASAVSITIMHAVHTI